MNLAQLSFEGVEHCGGIADDGDAEMPPSVFCPRVTGMAMAVIANVQLDGCERSVQCTADRHDAEAVVDAHGSTGLNGRTSVRAYTPPLT